MTLTLQTKIEKTFDIDLSEPLFRKLHNNIYLKFFQEEEKIKVVRHSTFLDGLDISVREVYESDYEAIFLNNTWTECSKKEFESVLEKRMKDHNLI